MTRARQLLYLTNTLSRELYGQRQESRPSRFLARNRSRPDSRIAPETPALSASARAAARAPTSTTATARCPKTDEAGDGDSLGVGAHVVHPTFGRGVVRRREGRGEGAKVWVHFERGGIKLLVLKFANLRPVAE